MFPLHMYINKFYKHENIQENRKVAMLDYIEMDVWALSIVEIKLCK